MGDVLRLNHRLLWTRILELTFQRLSELAIISAANQRPRLYGEYAKRAVERHGGTAEVIPVAAEPGEFGVALDKAVNDAELARKVREAGAVFFVGGAPQRLSRALLRADGARTALGAAVADVYAAGGVVVGGIPGHRVARTAYDAMSALERARFDERDLTRGLGLLDDDWYVDQHFFVAGRFAECLVAMRQLGVRHGLGVAANTAVVITGTHAEVAGDEGVMLVDLSSADPGGGAAGGFALRGARLSYLEHGDRLDMSAVRVTPHASKRDGFLMEPQGSGASVASVGEPVSAVNVFERGALVRLMREALDGAANEAVGMAYRDGRDPRSEGFRFRLYTGPDSVGWLSVDDGRKRYTMLNIRLDITPVLGSGVGD